MKFINFTDLRVLQNTGLKITRKFRRSALSQKHFF